MTYARLGTNVDDYGHAEFTSQDLKLACPIFHQYPFSGNLHEALACIRNDLPRLVLVGSSLEAGPAPSPWRTFVLEAQELLSTRYKRALTMTAYGATVAVWTKR